MAVTMVAHLLESNGFAGLDVVRKEDHPVGPFADVLACPIRLHACAVVLSCST